MLDARRQREDALLGVVAVDDFWLWWWWWSAVDGAEDGQLCDPERAGINAGKRYW